MRRGGFAGGRLRRVGGRTHIVWRWERTEGCAPRYGSDVHDSKAILHSHAMNGEDVSGVYRGMLDAAAEAVHTGERHRNGDRGMAKPMGGSRAQRVAIPASPATR